MDQIKALNVDAWTYLSEIGLEYLSMSHFREFPKCDILLNNICECFNKFIIEARDKQVLTMMEVIRCKLMVRIAKKREIKEKWKGATCPKIMKKMNEMIDASRYCTTMEGGGGRFQVATPNGLYNVDICATTCNCRKWQLTEIICHHTYSALGLNNYVIQDYLDPCYSVETHKKIYNHMIGPINGPDTWEDSNFHQWRPHLGEL